MIVLLIWPGTEKRRILLVIFVFSRDILVTPKRLNYAREKEKELYESLLALTNSKQTEIQPLILQAIADREEILADQACSLDIPGRRSTDRENKFILLI